LKTGVFSETFLEKLFFLVQSVFLILTFEISEWDYCSRFPGAGLENVDFLKVIGSRNSDSFFFFR